MSEPVSGTVALAAWVVAAALAAGAAGVTFGVAAWRRTKEAEGRLRQLERAVGEFYSALRARLAMERERAAPRGDGVEREAVPHR